MMQELRVMSMLWEVTTARKRDRPGILYVDQPCVVALGFRVE